MGARQGLPAAEAPLVAASALPALIGLLAGLPVGDGGTAAPAIRALHNLLVRSEATAALACRLNCVPPLLRVIKHGTRVAGRRAAAARTAADAAAAGGASPAAAAAAGAAAAAAATPASSSRPGAAPLSEEAVRSSQVAAGEAAAALFALVSYRTRFQVYLIQKHSGLHLLARLAEVTTDPDALLHSISAVAEVALDARWHGAILQSAAATGALRVLAGSGDRDAIAEAARLLGNLASQDRGRAAFHNKGATVDRKALKEQAIWHGLDHPNIVRYKGSFLNEYNTLSLVVEYVDGWSLAEHLAQFPAFPETLVADIARQTLCGLQYLHANGVTHRDLKPANLLVSQGGKVKICDFGVSTSVDVRTLTQGAHLYGTPHYIAPEMVENRRPLTTALDIWSLGCSVLELATGRRPYHELSAMQTLFRMVQDRHPPIPEDVSRECRDFLAACWVWDPRQRPSAAKLLEHPFIKLALPK
ncbi:hypothetical protein I4F81_011162 [Pyropia yezoensis]|uniref:Uncharacterized protein n=1 Tax=Pyropia yezoensis TaxID=2788 RepID=A0ACC3CFP0_PYRYE|nr:hypothetical protein I4F81_011162 [Neopyropia yezoensis]